MHADGYGAESGPSKMRFLKRHFLRDSHAWNAANTKYVEHYKSIEALLPPIAIAFEKTMGWSLHDAGVERIHRPRRGELFVELGCYRLEFLGVTREVTPDFEAFEEGTIWLYDEIDFAPPKSFIVRALFNEYGFEVTAQDVRVFCRSKNRYILPDEPPPPPPTLFADRRKGRRTR